MLLSWRCLLTAKKILFHGGYFRQPRKFVVALAVLDGRQGKGAFPWPFGQTAKLSAHFLGRFIKPPR